MKKELNLSDFLETFLSKLYEKECWEKITVGYLRNTITEVISEMDKDNQAQYVEEVQFEDVDDGETVDLGLPSGTKWAKSNIGAKKPSETGTYFAWGEIYGGNERLYNNGVYKFSIYEEESEPKKYNGEDEKVILDIDDDAAYYHNSKLYMPTKEQADELIKYTDNKEVTVNGVRGYLFTNKQDKTKSIFIPFTGFRYDDRCDDKGSIMIWTASRNKQYANCAWQMILYDKLSTGFFNRFYGLNVRGVERS